MSSWTLPSGDSEGQESHSLKTCKPDSNGPCGVFGAAVVIQSEFPPEAARLLADFMARKIDASTFALKMADVRASQTSLSV